MANTPTDELLWNAISQDLENGETDTLVEYLNRAEPISLCAQHSLARLFGEQNEYRVHCRVHKKKVVGVILWIDILEQLELGKLDLLVEYLRKPEPIPLAVQLGLADLLLLGITDREDKLRLRLLGKSGAPSQEMRNFRLYLTGQQWKVQHQKNRIPESQWEVLAKEFGLDSSGGTATVKKAYQRGREIAERHEKLSDD